MAQPRLPFLATLNLLDLSILTNESVSHDSTWPVVPSKIPSNIPKLEGKTGDDPGEHVMNFHLWCSSNSLNHDYVCLILFRRTLTGPTVKWYIEFPGGTYQTFNDLSMTFLNHFQLPMRYDGGIELLLTF